MNDNLPPHFQVIANLVEIAKVQGEQLDILRGSIKTQNELISILNERLTYLERENGQRLQRQTL